jgi:hypothetical protein
MPYYTRGHTALVAKACEIAGQIEEAATLADEALQIIERTGERWYGAHGGSRPSMAFFRDPGGTLARIMHEAPKGYAQRRPDGLRP